METKVLVLPESITEKLTRLLVITDHTTYSRNNIGQKCEGNCGLWVINEMIKKNIS